MYGMVEDNFSSTPYVFCKTIYEYHSRCRGATAPSVHGASVTNSRSKSNTKLLVKYLMFGPNALKGFGTFPEISVYKA